MTADQFERLANASASAAHDANQRAHRLVSECEAFIRELQKRGLAAEASELQARISKAIAPAPGERSAA